MMVGRLLLSFWDGYFSGAMSNFGVVIRWDRWTKWLHSKIINVHLWRVMIFIASYGDFKGRKHHQTNKTKHKYKIDDKINHKFWWLKNIIKSKCESFPNTAKASIDMYWCIYIYIPWAPKTVNYEGFGHLKNMSFTNITTKPLKHVGLLGPPGICGNHSPTFQIFVSSIWRLIEFSSFSK